MAEIVKVQAWFHPRSVQYRRRRPKANSYHFTWKTSLPRTRLALLEDERSVKGSWSVQENVVFAPRDLRPSEIMALSTLIGGRTGNMPQTLERIVESACLRACPGVGFQHEQS